MTKDITKKVIEIIDEKHIKPKPKWRFLLKDYFVWLFFSLSVVVGAISISAVIFVSTHQYYLLSLSQISLFQKIIMMVPYFWILLLIIFLVIAFYNFKHTKKGYRYSTYLIFGLSIASSVVLGLVIYSFGGGEYLEDIFYRHFPVYQRISVERGRLLLNPEQGMLVGHVVSQSDNKNFVLRDFRGQDWQIVFVGGEECCENLFKKQRLVILGKMISDNSFTAEIVRPFFHSQGLPLRQMKEKLRPMRINR